MAADTAILEEIGLTKTETKIYLALLRLGETTTTRLVRDSGIHASKVYEFLDKLERKGLVSHVVRSNKKHFSAAGPQVLKEMLREKRDEITEQEKRVDALIPDLERMRSAGSGMIQAEIYEGMRGVKSAYERMLSVLGNGGTQYVIGAPKRGNELVEGFLIDWHKRRVKKGIKCKYIYDSDARQYGKVREKMPLTEVRYLPKKMASPVWIEIFGDCVMIGHIRGMGAVLFLIHDSEIAKGYLGYFGMVWEASVT